ATDPGAGAGTPTGTGTGTGTGAATGTGAGTGTATGTGTGTGAGTGSAAAPADPPKSSTAELRFSGTWSSPSCGDRAYERRLTLKDDKTFRAEERVSPCPPKVQCVWSGILFWQGTFASDEKGIVLTKTGGADSGRGAKIESPLKLEVDKASGALVETRGGAKCPYTRTTAEGTKGTESNPPSPSAM
ncbi:MAG TPA: hypothetical protein VK459_08350, partial [Polyangiaceae bacterium]|nr:hypothetical protein [Polyangiaceae bacterium]